MKRKNKPLFPLFTDLSEYKIVVVGGGAVALRRVKTLLHFASDLTVVAPKICGELCALASEGKICLLKKKYEREDLYAAHMVLAATDDRAVNEDIYSACKCLGILVNVASDQNKCDFQFPSVILEEDMTIGINGGGSDHGKVKETRKKLESCLKGKTIYGE